ncbi:hypothetical protein G9C98_000081 [Cotesia typhae]|uniref:Ephrin RBD domain-containing protein n=1 Tax=Cotesia typhae TaxID=2053667 RepID=A0A8J5UYM8_9HYME|nr:hypothetical protein G9C98_000081 [Cotesia typhae]
MYEALLPGEGLKLLRQIGEQQEGRRITGCVLGLVSKEEYETCRITNPSPRVIAVCDKPTKTMYFTITFRPFTPQPGGLEFLPGHDYYFISTSSKDDLHRRIGGRCSTHNMKVVFKVCCANDGSSSTRNNNNRKYSYNYPGTAAAAPTLPHVPPPAIYPSHPHQPQPPIHNGPPSLASPPKTSITQKKKNKEYSDHPNEVVKNEELTYTGASSALSRPRESFQRLIYLSTVALLVSTLLPTLMR